MNTEVYRRRQRGSRTLLAILVLTLAPAAIIIAVVAQGPVLYAALLAELLVVLTFIEVQSMTIVVTPTHLEWFFGHGLLRKRRAIEQIVAAEAVRPSWWSGVGVHYVPKQGWLYNVDWGAAVLFMLRDGRKFLLGTDDLDGLIAAVRSVNPMVATLKR